MVNPALVTLFRGELAESCHRGAFAVVGSGGELLHSVGDILTPCFARSAIKAIQAIPLVESGAAVSLKFDQRELALACASHSGEREQVERVQTMLSKCDLDEAALACGAQWPLGIEAARALAAAGETPRPVHNNCSGKHAGMLALALHRGELVRGYEHAEHPVQRSIEATLAEMAEIEMTPAMRATDGCSVPTWALPLRSLAHAFAKFGTGAGLAPSRAAACLELMEACFAAPFFVAGHGRFCSLAMSRLPGRAFVKGGAEGVFCASLPELRAGVALKIDDGAKRAAEAVMAAVLASLLPKARAALRGVWDGRITNWRGEITGETRPSPELLDALEHRR